MNPDLQRLQAYPFEKLAALKNGIEPNVKRDAILLSVGEPKHAPPQFVLDSITQNLHGLSQYPSTRGSDTLRGAIADWLNQRFKLDAAPAQFDRHVLPVNGTREALFAFAQCVVDRTRSSDTVLIPNPFYQIYEGAALLAGLAPRFYNTGPDNDYQPEFSDLNEDEWNRCQLLYICSPGNPTGAVLSEETLTALIERAHKHDFVIAADECYSEIYNDEGNPPNGLLQACVNAGVKDFSRCIVFHSLSKRSNLPGLRSGFVAGDPALIDAFFKFRTYHGCAMSPVTQSASASAWRDEQHVVENRALYRRKFADAVDILSDVNSVEINVPDAGFYLWPQLPINDETFTRALFEQHNVTVLPGQYLGREHAGTNPGKNHVRIALVAESAQCSAGISAIRYTLKSLEL